VFRVALRGMALTEQHRSTGRLEKIVDQRRVFGLGQVNQPQVGLATSQRLLVETCRITVEHNLIAAAGQCLLQYMTLQGSVGNDRNARSSSVSHWPCP